MTRKQQLWALIVTSALTAFFQYIIQGSLATGANPMDFDPRFWQADRIFWGIRALIESWVVVYMFTTRTKKWYQEVILTILEIALLALIAFTLGPAFQALGAETTVYELLGRSYAVWAYAIGAYTSLMMAGAGIAYKIQPFDIEEKAKEAPQVVVEEERERSEYADWPERDAEARHERIVQFVEDHGPDGISKVEIWDAIWNGRKGSDSSKYRDIAVLVKEGRLRDVNGSDSNRVALPMREAGAF